MLFTKNFSLRISITTKTNALRLLLILVFKKTKKIMRIDDRSFTEGASLQSLLRAWQHGFTIEILICEKCVYDKKHWIYIHVIMNCGVTGNVLLMIYRK